MFKRPLVVLTLFATASATFAATASAEPVEVQPQTQTKDVVVSETGSYIVVMAEDPVVTTVGQDALDTPAADAIAEDLEREQDEVLADIGAGADDKVNTYTSSLNGFSALITHEEAEILAANPKVAVVLPDELLQHDTDSSGEYLGLTGPGEAWQSGLTGEDVVVGVIDNGIWPEHPSFADDGSYPSHPIQPLDDSVRPSCEFGTRPTTPTTSRSPATTSCSARVRCSTRTAP